MDSPPNNKGKYSKPIEDTTFDLTFHSPRPRGQDRGSSGDESEKEEKTQEVDILKTLKAPIGDDSEITHTHGDYGTYMKSESLESKMVDSIKRTNQYLRKWETQKFKELKNKEDQPDSEKTLQLERATLLCKNFHIPEKVLRKCRGTDHKLIFELVLVEAAQHFHRVMAGECPEVDVMLAIMSDLLRNKVLPELLSHARHCDENNLHEMIQDRLDGRTLLMENETNNFNKSEEALSILQVKDLQKSKNVQIPHILDNSAVQITKSLNQRIQEMGNLKQDLYQMLAELDVLDRAVGPNNSTQWRPFAPKWEGESLPIGERLEHFMKFV